MILDVAIPASLFFVIALGIVSSLLVVGLVRLPLRCTVVHPPSVLGSLSAISNRGERGYEELFTQHHDDGGAILFTHPTIHIPSTYSKLAQRPISLPCD